MSTQPTYLPRGGRMEGTYPLGGSRGQHSGRPSHVSPLFSYKYRGEGEHKEGARNEKRNGEKKRREGKYRKKERKEDPKRKKEEKNREKEKKQRKTERERRGCSHYEPLSPPLTATLRLHHP